MYGFTYLFNFTYKQIYHLENYAFETSLRKIKLRPNPFPMTHSFAASHFKNLVKIMKLNPIIALLLVSLFCTNPAYSQNNTLNSAEIIQGLKKLNTIGSVLYIAAHPDDENTRLLGYLANERKLRTGYLSLTRGDGGQNLIGKEQGELLGLIRTQELLAARRVDGAEQFFTRANDFGYSKTPEETLSFWNKDSILSDVVLTIRRFKPDVIICRFPTTGEGGHGHHTASAILALEAFEDVYKRQMWNKVLFTNNVGSLVRLTKNFHNYTPGNTARFDNRANVQVLDSWYNTDTVKGTNTGTFTVSDTSANSGWMKGNFKFCDLTPPASAPYVDLNSGNISSSITWCAATGIKELNEGNTVNAFPNPSNGTITFEGIIEEEIIISDELGRIICTIELNAANGYKSEVKDLENGIYFAKGKTANQKIIVLR